MIVALTSLACTASTGYGDCKGIAEADDPEVEYSVSTRNVVLAVIFSETIFVPAIVVLSEWKCPTGYKINFSLKQQTATDNQRDH